MNPSKFDSSSNEALPSLFILKKIDWEKRFLRYLTAGNSKGVAAKSKYIQNVAINANLLMIALSGGGNPTILRWKLTDTSSANKEANDEVIEIPVKSGGSGEGDNIESLFLDPFGNHCLVGLKNGDVYYLNNKLINNKPKKLSKPFQGNITTIAFDRNNNSDATTKSMLIGTSTGAIYEVVVDNNGKERFFKLIYQHSPPLAISSIFYENIPSASSSSSSANERYYVLFSTDSPTRLYHLISGAANSNIGGIGGGTGPSSSSSSSLHALFSEYSQSSTEIPFMELPGETAHADLLCFSKSSSSAKADQFALLSGAGIYHGSLKEIRNG
jgi:hypothetical protein